MDRDAILVRAYAALDGADTDLARLRDRPPTPAWTAPARPRVPMSPAEISTLARQAAGDQSRAALAGLRSELVEAIGAVVAGERQQYRAELEQLRAEIAELRREVEALRPAAGLRLAG